MEVFRSLAAYRPGEYPVVTVGAFDGVHRGHQALLRSIAARAQAQNGEAVLVTFHPHPRLVLQPTARLQLLQSLDEKLAALSTCGLDKVLVLPFTPELVELSPEKYVEQILVNQLKIKEIVVGYDHRFGKARSGGLPELRRLGERYGFVVAEIPAQEVDAAAVSSTRIRQHLLAGEVEAANALLGRPYTLSGLVVHGEQRGRTIGFPTANLHLDSPHKLVPQRGVYAGWARIGAASTRQATMLNIGIRPTVDGTKETIEAHLLDFSGDLYGEQLVLEIAARLREEQRFPDLTALQAQLESDRYRTLELLEQCR